MKGIIRNPQLPIINVMEEINNIISLVELLVINGNIDKNHSKLPITNNKLEITNISKCTTFLCIFIF